jgi:hypothetical protein
MVFMKTLLVLFLMSSLASSYADDMSVCDPVINKLGSKSLGISAKSPQDFLKSQSYKNSLIFKQEKDESGQVTNANVTYKENGHRKNLEVYSRNEIVNLTFTNPSIMSNNFLDNLTQELILINQDGSEKKVLIPRNSEPGEIKKARIKSQFLKNTEQIQRMWIQFEWRNGICIPISAYSWYLVTDEEGFLDERKEKLFDIARCRNLFKLNSTDRKDEVKINKALGRVDSEFGKKLNEIAGETPSKASLLSMKNNWYSEKSALEQAELELKNCSNHGLNKIIEDDSLWPEIDFTLPPKKTNNKVSPQ